MIKNRLTTDEPKDNTQNMLNLAFVENRWVKIRGMKVPFTNYIKSLCRKNGCDLSELDDFELCNTVCDCAFSNPECPSFLLYTIANQASELRERLKQYEDLSERGLLEELPCNVGDTVYVLKNIHKRKKFVDVKISPYIVDNIIIAETVSINLCNSENDWVISSINDFGVSVFTNIDEAKKALKNEK